MRYVTFSMWGVLAVAILTTLGQRSSMAGCCGGDEGTKAEAVVVAQKLCPVMGGAVKKDIFVDYKERRIYFCCNGCPETFLKDPEKYVKILDKQLKEAKPEAAPQDEHSGHAH